MNYFLKRGLPLLLGLFVGIAASYLTGAVRHPRRHQTAATPVNIYSVPEVDFPDSADTFSALTATIDSVALLDADGEVNNVKPLLPQARLSTDGRSSKWEQVGDDLTQVSLQQVAGIKFTPMKINGSPVAQLVSIRTIFEYGNKCHSRSISQTGPGCAVIEVTVRGDDSEVLWQANTAVDKKRGCFN